jgi:type I restriction enzyme S subunit
MRAPARTATIGDVCRVVGGGTPSRSRSDYFSGHIPWATVGDMNVELLEFTAGRITPEAIQQSASNIIPSGNVIIATRVGLGKVCILAQDTAINQDLRGVIPLDPDQLSERYLYWWFRSVSDRMIAEGTGATVQGVKVPFVKSLQIRIPTMAEQQRIVAILDEAFEGIAAAKANAEQSAGRSHALFESRLAEVFLGDEGWSRSTVGDVVKFIDYRGKTPKKTDSGLRLITAKNVKMGHLQENPMEFVAPDSYDAWMTRGIPKRGDVLFTTEAPLANVATLDTDEKVVFAQRIIIMQADETRLDNLFLKYMLLSRPVQGRIRAHATGATVSGIKASLLKTVEVSFPGLDVQRGLVNELDVLSAETQRLELVYRRKIHALDSLKKSLLNEAFSGNL